MVVLSSVAEVPENQLPQVKMIMAAEAIQTRIPKAQAMDCEKLTISITRLYDERG